MRLRCTRLILPLSVMALLVACPDDRNESLNTNTRTDTGSGRDIGASDVVSGTDTTTSVTDTTTSGMDTTPEDDATSSGDITISGVQSASESLECLAAGCMCPWMGGSAACEDAICNLADNAVFSLRGALVVSEELYVTDDTNAVFLADPAGGDYSGIELRYASDWTPDFEVGKTYDMEVRLAETFCNSELQLANLRNLNEVATATPPTAASIDASVLLTPADAEKWEGMLVTVTGSFTVAELPGGNTLELNNGLVVRDVFSIWFTGGQWRGPGVGTTVTSVTGFVIYGFDAYQIAPRSLSDIAFTAVADTRTLADIQGDAVGTSCPPTVGCNDENGDYCDLAYGVTVENLVVTSPIVLLDDNGNLKGAFAANPAGGQNSGIQLVWDADDFDFTAEELAVGTAITSILGDWQEIFCYTQLYINAKTDVTLSGTATPPTAASLTVAQLQTAEAYEGALVTLTGTFTVKVVEPEIGTGLVTVEDGSGDRFGISNTFHIWETLPTVDSTVYTSVTGFVRFYRGSNAEDEVYFVSPASIGDLLE